jgi:tripartite ATP-independent transporter DctM subunit
MSAPMDASRAGLVARARESAFIRAIDRAAEVLVCAALVGELALVVGNVLARLYLHHSFLWADEAARLTLSIIAFIGGAVAYRRHDHAAVRFVIGACPRSVEQFCEALTDIFVFFISAVIGIVSIEFIVSTWDELSPVLQTHAAIVALPLPAGMALIAIHALMNLLHGHGKRAIAIGAGFVALAAAAALSREYWIPLFAGDRPIVAALALFFAAILAGMPVGFVLLLSTAVFLWLTGAPLIVLPQTMVNGTGNYILLAVPFFILAGLVMERGGISIRLVRFIETLVGHMRGGLLQVTVVSMYLMSGLSGSKPADVAAVGTVMRDRLRERHGAAEGAAVLAAAAVMGETVPPSIAMLIVGSITSVSIAAMFIGGMIPAAVMALCLMTLIYVRARGEKSERLPRAPFGVMARAGARAALPLIMPVALIGGVVFGIATPTEIAALAVIYGLVLSVVVYREMDLWGLIRAVTDTAALTGVLLFIFAASSGFSWVLTIAYLPQRLVMLLQSIGNSTEIFMIGSIVLLIVVGVLLEGLPSLNVLAPLLLPIAGKLGLSEMHYALVLIIAMGVGGFMPLAGIGFYVCCAVMRCDIESASRAMMPYLVVTLAGLLLIAFVPWFALFLPHYFGFRG